MQEMKTAGLILSSVNLNDNDKLFTIQTRDGGKISAISKGIRSHKHKDFAALQNFCYSDMVITFKGGLGYISSASIINNFYGIRNSVEQMSYAAYFADVIKSFPEELPLEDDYFSFVLNTLYLVSMAEKKCKDGDISEYLVRLKSVFEIKTVCFAGFMPDLCDCANCHSKKELEYFDTSSGVLYCKKCHNVGRGDLVEITPSVHKMLLFMCESDYKSVFAYGGDEKTIKIISHISETYMINTMEIYPKGLSYLKTLTKDINVCK